MRYILVLVTLFNLIIASHTYGEFINRVVAYVDNIPITLLDFEKEYLKMKEKLPNIEKEEVISTMINKTVLLKKAKELFLEGKEEELLNSYIDLKIKASIIIPENQIRQYYEQNKTKINKPYSSVRAQIENYLYERELNKKLKEHIEELKEAVEIKIVFIP